MRKTLRSWLPVVCLVAGGFVTVSQVGCGGGPQMGDTPTGVDEPMEEPTEEEIAEELGLDRADEAEMSPK